MNDLTPFIETCTLPISRREKEISAHIAAGQSESEISARLHISTNTVHNHARNIRRMIGARSAVDVARKFILSLPDPKRFIAVFFLGLQLFATFKTPDLDFRRAKNSNPIIKTVKTNRKEA